MSINWRRQCYLFNVFRKNDRLKMVLTVAFLFLFTHSGAQQSQLKGPENTLSVVGSNATLKCLSPSRNCSGIEWMKHIAGNPASIFNSQGIITNPFRDRYSVDNKSGCHLIIENVQLTDAGRFNCRALISSNTVETSAYLIILEAQPSCSINASLHDTVEKDGVRLTCEVTYNGADRALMAWKGVDDAPADVIKNKTISRSYSVVASAPEVPSFTCITSFALATNDNGVAIVGLATNEIPGVTCATPAIKVLYSVRDIQLSPSFSNYPPGAPINCAAKGHPSPTFKWHEMEDSGVWMDIQNQNGSQFIMTDVSSKRYRCVAMNVVRGTNYNATSHEFQVNNTGSTTSDSTTSVTTTPIYLNLTVQIGVGAGVGVILLIVLLLICFLAPCCPGYKCRHSSEKVKIREEQPLTENPDIYSNINDAQLSAPKAKPRSAEPPKLPQNAPPQAKPRTDNKKAVPANAYHHEEVTYAELAREDGPHQVIPKNDHVPQETLYAAVGTA